MRWALIREIMRGTVTDVEWSSSGQMTIRIEATEELRRRLTY